MAMTFLQVSNLYREHTTQEACSIFQLLKT